MTETETKLPMYQQDVHQEASPTAPAGSYQPNAQQLEVQHHDERNDDDNNPQSKNDSDIILPIDPGDVPQQKYLSLEFDATFHEHKKTSLVKPMHDILGIVYKWTKLITYHVFVIIIGIPLMIVWALVNGITAFTYSWLWSPAMRITIFWIAATLPLVTMPLVTIFRPLTDVAARCLSQIRVKAALDGKGFVQNV
ncbi:uncharacterized protein LOC135341430 [Halichondria panicea]|uniref:uncharacterized protein LOC135341430 n=1 Tax=Halichondria panicea TaxID=6063 RepID=UPI00312B6171